MYKNNIFYVGTFIFIIFNLIIFQNLGLYNDDWLFYNISDQTFSEWSLRVWNGEGGIIKRHVVVPYYIILHLIPPFFVYCFSLILSFIIFLFFFQLIKRLINENIIENYKKEISLNQILIIFLIWYFLPFNIGGQFWITGIIHTKLSTIFFLISLKFLIDRKIFLSLIFLGLSFNSYEIFFFSYLPISLIFYVGKLIKKKDFQIFFFGSLLIQLFFLINKIRPENSIEKIDYFNLFVDSFLNLARLAWGMFSTIPLEISIYIKILLILIIIIPIIFISFQASEIYKNHFFKKLVFLLIFSLILNSLVMTLGKYGYWGKGIFSRTMFMPSILFLFFISIILSTKSKINIIFTYFFFIITISIFLNEINNWKKSKNIQAEIIEKLKIFNQFEQKKNLILFKGPCYINGVDIFNATWDLNSAVEINYPNLATNNFIPTQDWKITMIDNQKLSIHIFDFELKDYENLILWDYNKNKIEILDTSQNLDLSSLSFEECNIGSNEKKRAKEFVSKLEKL